MGTGNQEGGFGAINPRKNGERPAIISHDEWNRGWEPVAAVLKIAWQAQTE
jgi:hypothetical protein